VARIMGDVLILRISNRKRGGFKRSTQHDPEVEASWCVDADSD